MLKCTSYASFSRGGPLKILMEATVETVLDKTIMTTINLEKIATKIVIS